MMKRLRIRRLFQFSLRTLLVVVVLLSVWLGMTVRKARQQKAAMAWVETQAGYWVISVHDGWLNRGKSSGRDLLDGLISHEWFVSTMHVTLSHNEVRDLTPLAELTKLTSLRLIDTQVTDLSPLARLTSLRILYLEDTPVTEEEVAKLQKTLPNCEIRHNHAG